MNTKTNLLKSIFISLILVMGVGSMNAANTMRIYCKNTQSWWKADGAAVGAYYWGTGGNANSWPGTRMTKVPGQTDLWYIDVDIDKYQNIIFTRVNGSGSVADWGAKTGDLTIASTKNQYTITQSSGAWDGATSAGSWGTYKPTSTAALATSAANIFVGGQATLTSSLTSNTDANTIKGTAYAISPAGANVNGNTFTATAAGTYTVTATVTYYPLGCPTLTSTATATATITVANPPVNSHNITYTAQGTGWTYSNSNPTTAEEDATVTFEVIPTTGYTVTVTSSDVSLSKNGNIYTFTMPTKDVTINVSATEDLHAITVQSSNNNHGTVTKSADKAGIATFITITAEPEEGYRFVNWTTETDGITIADANNASTTVTATAAGTVTANFEEIPLETIYFVNDKGWTDIKVHLWGGTATETTWPGTAATKADFQLHCCDVYYISAPEGSYENCIFNNGSGSQTGDLTWTAGKYYYNGEWKTLDELTYEVQLAGSMLVNNGDWVLQDMTVDANSTNSIIVSLEANTTYEFKIVVDGAWHGNTGTMTYGNSTGWTMSSSEDTNCKIKTAGAGNYIFTYDVCTAKLTVTYPTSYTVTYSQTPAAAADAPTTTPSVASGKYVAADTEVTFTAQAPETGYTFKGWYDNSEGTDPALSSNLAYTPTITANTTIYAVYTVNTYNINIVANPTEAAESLTTSPQAVGAEKVNISTTAKFTYKFDNWTATDGITITDANNPSTSITATKAGTVTAHFTKMQPTTVYLKPNTEWKQSDARFAIHYWHDGQPVGWVDMTDVGCNRDYFVGSVPAGYTQFKFVRMNPETNDNNWDNDWNETGTLNIPTDGKNLFTLPASGDHIWNGATGTWGTYTPSTYTININAPESGTITVTIDGNTTTVTNEATTIEDVALNAQMTVAFTPATGYELGKAIIEIGNNDDANAAGTYTVCGPTEITAYFVTKEDQIVYLRPTDAWLADNARFAAYAFNRYAGTEAAQWIELTTKDTDYTGAFSDTIPPGFSHVQFVRMPETGDFSFDIDLAHTINFSIPVDNNNRFLIGDAIASGSDAGKYQGSWEASDTPIYGIPGDWQGNKNWSADAYPLMGPDGEVTVNITQTNTTLGFKVYHYPYGSDNNSAQWLGNNGTMVRGGAAVHEGGWTMETDKDNCGLGVDVAGDYIFAFNIRNKKLTVTYPEIPTPTTSIVSEQRVFEDEVLAYGWVAGDGTEANPYQLYADEAARITLSPIPAVEGLTAYYQFGNNEEQTSNVFDWKDISSQATTMEVKAYYKNAMGAKSAEATVNTSYFKTLALPFYLMTQPKDEINIDIAAGANITVQFRSDSKATVDLYLNDTDGTPLTTITNEDSYDFEYDVPDDIEPCILTFIAKAQGAGLHGRIFEVKADVAIYKNVIIKVNDPEGWVKNAYMWRDGSGDVLTSWPGDPVLQNYGTWRVFSVKYPYYDRFIVNDGQAEGATQTIDYVLPADDTCYELLAPANNGSSDPADANKYGLQVADCPENLLVEDIKDTTITEGEQIVVMPKIFVGLGYQVADIEASVHYDNNGSINAMMSGTNVTILGNAEGQSNVTVTYILDNIRIEKKFKVTVTKRTKITIQVKVPKEGTSGAVGWTNHDGVYLRYWHTGDGTNLLMTYLKDVGDYDYYEADVPLDANGETNFHLFYEEIDDNNRWRQTINKTIVKEDGCYLVTQDGGNYYRGLEDDGVRCLTNQYQVRIAMGSGKTYSSNIVTAEEDTLSFFAPGMNETGYKAGVIMLYQNDKMIATIEPSTFAVSNVYTATLNDALNGLDNVSTYSGNFYIRTWGTDGDISNKGWNSVQDWNDSEKASRTFTEFVSREGEFYNHYWVQAMNSGGYDGKDVSACVANDYNDDLAGKLLKDKNTNEYGDIKVGTGKVINVRFGYDPRTNYFGRAVLQGSADASYLNLHCDNAYADKECTKKLPYGNNTNNDGNKFRDVSNWVYERDVYVNITNGTPSASLYVEAKSPRTDTTVYNHLLGYGINEVTGEETSTPIQKTVIGSGTDNGVYKVRVVYDFKTNRIIAVWEIATDLTITTDKTVNADVLFIRKENEDVPQITLSGNGEINNLKSLFFAMELHRINTNKDERHEEQYMFTLPFDCVVGSISGVHGYMELWGIQRYRGDLRAQKGWYAETATFWEWMSPKDTLKAGEGYLLAFDKKNATWNEIEVNKTDANGDVIEGQKETISMLRLYFPSIGSGFDLQQQSAEQLTVTYPNHPCTLTLHNRYLQDSNWKMIGTTSYNNATVSGYAKDNEEYKELNEAPSFRYRYSYTFDNNNNRTSYDYEPEVGDTATYKSFYGYMVQFAGTITWNPINETVPEPLAAPRRAQAERSSVTMRLELANTDGKKQDQTFVALDENGTTTFDQNKDLNKVFNSGKSNIYTLSEGIPFAGNTLPMGEALVPVGVQIDAEGEYTFRMPDGTEGMVVELIDYEAGTTTNMLLSDYTVTLSKGTHENRFALHVQPEKQVGTGVGNVGDEAKGDKVKGIEKYLIDGKLVIRTAEGAVYDAQGHVVQ